MRIKPGLWADAPGLAHPDWKWFWSHRSLVLLYREGAGPPLALVDGSPKRIVTADSGPTVWSVGQLGIRGEYEAAGSTVTHHILNADLPDWFPGKASEPFTALALCQPRDLSPSRILNTLQKDGASGPPYFLWFEDGDGVEANLTGVNTIAAGQNPVLTRPGLYGSLWDGATARIIYDGRLLGTTASISSIATNTGPLNIGTRGTTYAGSTRAYDGFVDAVYFLRGALQPEQIAQLAVDPFGPFRRARRLILLSEVAADVTVDVPTAALTLTGLVPTVDTGAGGGGATVAVPATSLTLTGLVPTVLAPATVDVPVASLTLTGLVPTAVAPETVDVPASSLSLTGLVPTISTGNNVSVDVPVASLSLTGLVPTVVAPWTVAVPAAALTLTGWVPTAVAPVTHDVPTAALALTGYEPSILTGNDVNVQVPLAALSLAGVAPTVVAPYALTVPAATLTLNGGAPSLGTRVPVPAAGLTMAGLAPLIIRGIVVPPATLEFTGYAPSIDAPYALTVPVASLTLTAYIPSADFRQAVFTGEAPLRGALQRGRITNVSQGGGQVQPVGSATGKGQIRRVDT